MRHGRRRQRQQLVAASQAGGKNLVSLKNIGTTVGREAEPGNRLLSKTGREYLVQPDGSWKRVATSPA